MRIPIYLIGLLLWLLAMIAYGPSLRGGYVWDDHLLVEKHPVSTGQAPVAQAFSDEMYAGTHTNYYRPLVLLSYRAQGREGKFNPLILRVSNVTLHAALGFLLFLFFRRISRDDFCAVMTALLFILHPLQTETVAYISGRADILAAFFVMASWLCWMEQERFSSLSRRAQGMQAASLIFFLLALLSKETVFVFPLVLWAWRRWGPQGSVRAALWPFVIIVFFYAAVRLSWLDFSGGGYAWGKKSIALMTAGPVFRSWMFLKSLAMYAGDTIFPFDLHMMRSLIDEKIGMRQIAASGILGAMLFWLWRQCRRGVVSYPLFLGSLVWFFAWLLPQSAFAFPYIRADHFLYLSSGGLFFLGALFLKEKKYRRWACLGLALYFGMCTWAHAGFWRDEHDFFKRLYRLSPSSVKVAESLAASYMDRGEPREALMVYLGLIDRSLGAEPLDFCAWSGRAVQALCSDSSGRRFLAARFFFNAGVLLENAGRVDDALCAYRGAQQCDGLLAQAFNNAGLLVWRQGYPGALEWLKKAVEVDPFFVPAWNNLAAFLASQGRMEEAQACLSEALRLEPDYAPALRNREVWKAEN